MRRRLVALDAVGGDAEEIVGQAKHATYLDDLVERGDGGLEGFEGRSVLAGDIDVDEHLEAAADRRWVDERGVAEDDPVALQALDTAQARCRGQADPVSEFDVSQASVAPKLSNDSAIKRVHSREMIAHH